MQLSPEAAEALAGVRKEPPPNGFGQGELFTRHLQVNYLSAFGQTYWIYDHEGFLCATSDLRVVDLLLRAEAEPPPDPSRPLVHGGARELLFPGSSFAREENLLRLQENARKSVANFKGRPIAPPPTAFPSGSMNMTGDPSGISAVPTDEALKILGL